MKNLLILLTLVVLGCENGVDINHPNQIGDDVYFGRLTSDGNIEEADPMIPLMNEYPDDWFVGYIGHSLLARVIRISLPNCGFNDVDSVIVLINVFDQNHVKYNDVPEVAVTFYRGASNGERLYFQTMTQENGKPILFSKNIDNQGMHEDGIILCLKSNSDIIQFYLEE